jgi:hypothetical protein
MKRIAILLGVLGLTACTAETGSAQEEVKVDVADPNERSDDEDKAASQVSPKDYAGSAISNPHWVDN